MTNEERAIESLEMRQDRLEKNKKKIGDALIISIMIISVLYAVYIYFQDWGAI